MKRQKVRNAILLISFLLMPVTQFYFSPYLIIDAAAQGIVNGSLIVFAILFTGGMFLGRSFCGWVMPCGGLQEICFKVNNNKSKGGRLNNIKYFMWVPWLSAIIWLSIRSGGYSKIDPLYNIDHGISVSQPVMYIIYYGVIVLVVLMAFTLGKRAVCHYICWMAPFMIMGRKLGRLLHLPMLRLRASAKCKSCNLCVQSCPMSLNVTAMVQNNDMENSECILCGNCVDTCLNKAVKYGFGWPDTVNQKKPVQM